MASTRIATAALGFSSKESEGRRVAGRGTVDGDSHGRVPVRLDRRPRIVQQGADGPEIAIGQHDGPGRVQGDRQEARIRRVVRAQVPAQGARNPVRGPAPEHRQNASDIRHSVHCARVHGLLRGRRSAQPPAARQEHTSMAGTNVFQVSRTLRLTFNLTTNPTHLI